MLSLNKIGRSVARVAVLAGIALVPQVSQAADDGEMMTFDTRTARKAARKGVTAQAISSRCSSSTPVSGLLIKSQISKHISRGDARASGYTLVCGKRCVQFVARFFYANGEEAGQFGYYGRFSGNGQPRAYGGAGGAAAHSVSQIQSKARRLGNSTLYLQTRKGAKSPCLTFNAFASRTGSP